MSRRAQALVLVTLLALAVWLGLSVANAPLRNPAAPSGITSLALAGSADRAAQIIARWGPPQREAAAFSLGLDFLFLFLYPTALSLGVGLAAGRLVPRHPRLAQWGEALALALPLAAVFDAVENAAVWQMLQLGATDGRALVAATSATLKLALVTLGLAYLAAAGLLGRSPPRR